MQRYLSAALARDSQKKMVLITGPRQVGKTTLEVKWSDAEPAPALRYFAEHTGVPAVQLVADLKHEREMGPCKVRHADGYLGSLRA